MSKLDIAISSIKHSIEINDEELESFKKIISTLNKKTNELVMDTGKISDRLLLFILILIDTNKKEKIFDNFEENIIKLLKKVSPFFNNKNDLDTQLVLSSIIIENETQNLPEPKKPSANIEKENLEKDTIEFLDEITELITKLSNNIKTL